MQEFEIVFPLNDYNEVQHDIAMMNATQDKWHDMEVESSLKTFENTLINDSPLQTCETLANYLWLFLLSPQKLPQ